MNTPYTNLKSRRWLFLALCCVINFFTGALYAWSVFASALAPHLSSLTGSPITVAQLGTVFGVATGVTPLLMLAEGFINDRFGPRLIIVTGGILLSLGYALTAYAESLFTLYLTYGLCVGAGTGLVNGCTINSAVKFFPDRRGLAGGTVTASLGVGGALLPFLVNALVTRIGISLTFLVFALLLGVMIVGAALPLIKCPNGFSDWLLGQSTKTMKTHDTPTTETNLTWKAMLQTARFYPLFVIFAICSTLGLMLISNISAIARDQMGFSAGLVTLSVSSLSLANTGGRFLSGTLSDRLGRIPTLQLMLVLALVALTLLYYASPTDTVQFLLGLIGIGLCYGASFGIYPGLVADEFGPLHNSVNFSVMAFAYSIGGFLGPWIIRTVVGQGSYTLAYALGFAVAILGLMASLWYWRAKAKDTHRAQ